MVRKQNVWHFQTQDNVGCFLKQLVSQNNNNNVCVCVCVRVYAHCYHFVVVIRGFDSWQWYW